MLARARELYGEELKVYDPFAGSGMIGFEALRLGLSAELSDYNPVAYLIMKATIEYPKKYGMKLADDVEKEGKRIIEEIRKELGEFYPKHGGKEVKAYIWAWAVKCPRCGKVTPLVNDWQLSEEEYLAHSVVNGELRFEVKKGKSPEGNVVRGEGRCLFCDMIIKNEDIVRDIRENKREILLALALEGKEFSADVKEHMEAFKKASEYLKQKIDELAPYIPDEEMPYEVRSSRYLLYWRDLFNDRQLLVLATLAKKVKETAERYRREHGEDYGRAVAAALAAWVAKHVDFNSRPTTLVSVRYTIGHALANRGIGVMWKHAETNPLVKFSGSLSGMLNDVVAALRFSAIKLSGTSGSVEIRLASALSPPATGSKYSLIVTDPPYYDDVAYGELSEFFYVWERRILEDFFPEAFSTSHVDVSESIDACGDRSPDTFYSRLEAALANIYSALKDDGLLVLFYAHRSMEVWRSVADILWKVGFQITSAIPLSTENENNVIAQGKRNIYYSLVLTARKRREKLETTLGALEEEIEKEIRDRLEYVREFNYKQGELFLWAVGVALRVVTKYEKIESFSAESVASTALEYAQRVTLSVFLREDMKSVLGREINLDRETQFYLAVLKGGTRELDNDEFNRLVKSSGVIEDELLRKGLVVKRGGEKARMIVRDAFERAGEVEGYDRIKGSSIIDEIHRCFVAFNRKPGFDVIEEHAKKAALPLPDFLGVIKMINYYCDLSKALSGAECVVSGRILDAEKRYLGTRGGNLDKWL
ncbi:MAG: DNA methylase [Nitrososphaeria archaeon]